MMVRLYFHHTRDLSLNDLKGADIDSDELKGIIPRITEQIFQSIVESDAHLEYFVKVSYMEIYLERIRDLLQRECGQIYFILPTLTCFNSAQNDNLQIHEEKSKGVYVKNLSDYYVSSAREVYEIMRQGGAARVVTSTSKLPFLKHLYKFKGVASHRYER